VVIKLAIPSQATPVGYTSATRSSGEYDTDDASHAVENEVGLYTGVLRGLGVAPRCFGVWEMGEDTERGKVRMGKGERGGIWKEKEKRGEVGEVGKVVCMVLEEMGVDVGGRMGDWGGLSATDRWVFSSVVMGRG